MDKLLMPAQYARLNKSTFFTIEDMNIAVDYTIAVRKKYGLIPLSHNATVKVDITDERSISRQYQLPRDLRVGEELSSIERTLYNLADEAIRSAVQLSVLSRTEAKVKTLEELALSPDLEKLHPVSNTARTQEATTNEYEFVDKLADQLLLAIKHVTNVTSLNRTAFEAYKQERETGMQKVLDHVDAEKSLTRAVVEFLDYDIDTKRSEKEIKEKTLEFIMQAHHARPQYHITPKKIAIIVDEFVPRYLALRKREADGELPSDIVDHAFESFIDGGFKGWIALSLFGETVINYVLKTNYDIPGWYIGAGVQFALPYLKFLGAPLRHGMQQRKLRKLIESTDRRLLQCPSEDDVSLQEYIQSLQSRSKLNVRKGGRPRLLTTSSK